MSEPEYKLVPDYERASQDMDWQQVVLNGGPPCFHLESDGRFCGRAKCWDGHDYNRGVHGYVSLANLIRLALDAAPSPPKDPRDEALKVAREALDAMISDGWLSYGPEGMSEAQNKCYDAHLKIKEIMGEK